MSYVDAWFDRDNDIIKIVERNKKGEREFRDIPVREINWVINELRKLNLDK